MKELEISLSQMNGNILLGCCFIIFVIGFLCGLFASNLINKKISLKQ